MFKLVQRATKLGTFDLLLPGHSVSFQSTMFKKGMDKEVQAMLLEMQLAALDASLDKKETSAVVESLVGDLLELYSEAEYPIRRAR